MSTRIEKKRREKTKVPVKPTCSFRHAPLSDIFGPWDSTTVRAGLLPVFVAPFPVWVGFKVGLFNLETKEHIIFVNVPHNY